MISATLSLDIMSASMLHSQTILMGFNSSLFSIIISDLLDA